MEVTEKKITISQMLSEVLSMDFSKQDILGRTFNYLFNIVTSLGTGLDEHNIELLCFALSFFCRYLSLVWQICLVANQHYNDITSTLCPNIVNPFGCLMERISICTTKTNLSQHEMYIQLLSTMLDQPSDLKKNFCSNIQGEIWRSKQHILPMVVTFWYCSLYNLWKFLKFFF